MTTLIPVTLQAPKELNDVRIALVDLISMIKAKKGVTEILGKLSEFMAAVDGASNIPTEFKDELKASVETVGYMGGQLVGVLLA